MTLKALIFDFDGVILDTETPDFDAWQKVFSAYGSFLPLDEWMRGLGTSPDAFNPVAYLADQIGKPLEYTEVKDEHRRIMFKDLADCEPIPGVRALIQAASAEGLQLAVASSSPRSWVEPHLQKLGLRESFSILCTKEDVALVKPDPALYRLAVERLGVSVDEAIAIEDSPNGIRAARGAGLYALAVPIPLYDHLDCSQANAVVRSLEGISIEQLKELRG